MTISPTSYEVLNTWATDGKAVTDPVALAKIKLFTDLIIAQAEAVGVDLSADFIYGYIAASNMEREMPGVTVAVGVGLAMRFIDGVL